MSLSDARVMWPPLPLSIVRLSAARRHACCHGAAHAQGGGGVPVGPRGILIGRQLCLLVRARADGSLDEHDGHRRWRGGGGGRRWVEKGRGSLGRKRAGHWDGVSMKLRICEHRECNAKRLCRNGCLLSELRSLPPSPSLPVCPSIHLYLPLSPAPPQAV